MADLCILVWLGAGAIEPATLFLGYMMVSHGLGHSALAMAHLITHACFKAALFLGAGAVIHATNSNQDQRRYGGVPVTPMPTTIQARMTTSLLNTLVRSF